MEYRKMWTSYRFAGLTLLGSGLTAHLMVERKASASVFGIRRDPAESPPLRNLAGAVAVELPGRSQSMQLERYRRLMVVELKCTHSRPVHRARRNLFVICLFGKDAGVRLHKKPHACSPPDGSTWIWLHPEGWHLPCWTACCNLAVAVCDYL